VSARSSDRGGASSRQRWIVKFAGGREAAITRPHRSNLLSQPQEMNAPVVPFTYCGRQVDAHCDPRPARRLQGSRVARRLVLIIGVWFWDASLLTVAADENLRLLKAVTGLLPFDWASKVESALRIFGADRALLLIEGVAVAKLILLSLAYPFRGPRP